MNLSGRTGSEKGEKSDVEGEGSNIEKTKVALLLLILLGIILYPAV